MTLPAGARLGPYVIVAPLGSGGMGDVYRARDPRLNRDIAIKVLPALGADDPERRERFAREAQAVAALNHPNIVTIHSVEEADGTTFLTMEIVEGRSLADVLVQGPLPLDRVLKVAIAVADAIAAAHQKGITHRDLKPGNVMLGEHDQAGRVKVLDFGLAKLVSAPSDAAGMTTVAAAPITGEGRILGTVAYMSPEQAEGKPIDARSDLFSLGVVLYEMATGQRPFTGDTNMSVISAILRDTPKSVSDLNAALPPELGRIVRRALAKDPERRYQTAKDLRNDLEELKTSLDSGELAAPVPSRSRATVSRRWWAAALVVGAVALVGVGAWMWRPTEDASAPFERVEARRLTTTGMALFAAVSPDGRYIVHVHNENGQHSLWMRQIATGSNVQIAAPTNERYTGVAVSPDANFVFFLRGRPGAGTTLYQMPLLGGPVRRILDDVDAMAVSPDGTRIAFTQRDTGPTLKTASVDGTDVRELARIESPDFFSRPSWSRDGSLVAVSVQSFAGTYHGSVFVVPATGGSLTQVGSHVWYAVRDVAWLSPSSLAVIAAEQTEFPNAYQVYAVSYPGGQVRRLTSGVNNHTGLSATADGASLVTVLRAQTATLWVSPPNDLSAGREITTGQARRDHFPAWTPDGRIVHTAFGNGHEVWIRDADGSNARPIVNDKGLATHLSVCGDDRVVFTTDREGAPHVWQVALDGSDLRQLVNLPRGESNTACSRDGRHVVFVGYEGRRLLRVGPNGPEPLDDGRHASASPSISPDNRWIAYNRIDPDGNAAHPVVIPITGNAPPIQFEFAPGSQQPRQLAWRADSSAITYVQSSNGVGNLWMQPLAGGSPKKLTELTSGQIFEHAWSADGRLATARGSLASDVVLLSGR